MILGQDSGVENCKPSSFDQVFKGESVPEVKIIECGLIGVRYCEIAIDGVRQCMFYMISEPLY